MDFQWVTLNVSDYQTSLQFYSEKLGLEIDREMSGEGMQMAFLGKPDQPKVEIIGGAVHDGQPGKGVSMGFAVEDLDELVNRLKADGCTVTGPISPNPAALFYFVTDPDGYTVQLLQK